MTRDGAWEQYRALPLNSDRFTQDQLEQDAFIAGWDAAKADLPDRKEALVDLLYSQGLFSHLIPEFQADSIHDLADAVLALFRGEEPK